MIEWQAAELALAQLFAPMHLLMFMLGLLMGLVLGVLPGIDALFGLAVLLPFCLVIDATSALPLILGMASITFTSGPIPSILIGAPGTAGSTATILDGHPMAKRGEAGKAMGAAFTASLIGGLVGAIVLTLSIPIFRPLVLMLGSPEFLCLCILGLSLVSVLGGKYPLRGVVAAGLGIMLAQVGLDPIMGVNRWTFGTLYLQNRISIVVLALGFFALAEIVDLSIKGTRISGSRSSVGKWDGLRETLKHKKLALESALIGSFVGFLPGLGAGVACWIAYAWALVTCKPRSGFGKGDIRGVIAPEASDNASVGGALIPTIAFGIPGGTLMALLLSAFWMLGIKPGPNLMTKNLHLVYLMIWTMALSNIVGAILCFLFTDLIAKIATIRIGRLAPIVIMLIFSGALVTNMDISDVVAVVLFCLLGLTMKHLDWPRPPMLLGYILGPLIEKFYFSSQMIFGYTWMARPGVIVILILTTLCLYVGIKVQRKETAVQEAMEREEARP
jgi:TctA family transporter